jgi:ABC-type glycerol-3-phosphate transport system permease component
VQILVVAAIVAAACAGYALSRRRDDLLVLGLVLAAWLVPLMIGGLNLYRTDAALLPALVLTRRLPAAIQLLLLALAALSAFLIATLFFQSRLE